VVALDVALDACTRGARLRAVRALVAAHAGHPQCGGKCGGFVQLLALDGAGNGFSWVVCFFVMR
jgi:hypothetical protein